MDRSESIEKIAEALSAAQAKMPGARKDATNPHFKSRYADLASIWDACRGPLTEHGLSVIQTTRIGEGGGISLVTTLLHASGQWVSGEMPILADSRNPQSMGSWITYLRRYALAAIAGIAPEDDDGEAATTGRERPDEKAWRTHNRIGNGHKEEREEPREPSNPPSETWSQYVGARLRRSNSEWTREMVKEGVEPGARQEHKELANDSQVVNHLCSRLIELEQIRPEAVAKSGRPEVRDPTKARQVVAMFFDAKPTSIKKAVEMYLDSKREEARVALGIPGGDLDKEEVEAQATTDVSES